MKLYSESSTGGYRGLWKKRQMFTKHSCWPLVVFDKKLHDGWKVSKLAQGCNGKSLISELVRLQDNFCLV